MIKRVRIKVVTRRVVAEKYGGRNLGGLAYMVVAGYGWLCGLSRSANQYIAYFGIFEDIDVFYHMVSVSLRFYIQNVGEDVPKDAKNY